MFMKQNPFPRRYNLTSAFVFWIEIGPTFPCEKQTNIANVDSAMDET